MIIKPPPSKEQAPEPDPVGLRCPGCYCAHLPVLYTRHRPGGRIMRVRECRNCKRRISTFEKVVGGE